MDSVCKNCELKLKRSDCSLEEYVECATRYWVKEYIKYYDIDELIELIEADFLSKNKENNWHETKDMLLNMAQECIDRSRKY